MANELERRLCDVLGRYLSDIMTRSVVSASQSWARVDLAELRPGDGERLLEELDKGVRLYVRDPESQERCLADLRQLLGAAEGASVPAPPTVEDEVVSVGQELDVATASSRARALCRRLGFSPGGQIKVTTAIAEIAQQLLAQTGRGEIVIRLIDEEGSPGIEIVARDPSGDDGQYGVGLSGARTLMDELEVSRDDDEGVHVRARKYLH